VGVVSASFLRTSGKRALHIQDEDAAGGGPDSSPLLPASFLPSSFLPSSCIPNGSRRLTGLFQCALAFPSWSCLPTPFGIT